MPAGTETRPVAGSITGTRPPPMGVAGVIIVPAIVPVETGTLFSVSLA